MGELWVRGASCANAASPVVLLLTRGSCVVAARRSQVRGPNIMKGYFNNEKATEAMITHEGWLKTGDLGYYDKACLLRVARRRRRRG